MKHRSKLSSEQQQQEQVSAEEARLQASREFASAEETLRFDAAQTEVPARVAERLKQSLSELSPAEAPRPWWKKFLGQ